MLNKKNIEIIYDAVDGIATLLYEQAKIPYLQGVAEACEAIRTGRVDPDLPEAVRHRASPYVKTAREGEFAKEEVRKALQLAFLKGFKHARRPNADITPDTVGIFAAYLLAKLLPGDAPVVLFDPFLGTGNLLVTVANHLERKTKLLGVERDFAACKLAEALFRMTDAGDDVYCQDSFTFSAVAADAIVTDLPTEILKDGTYVPHAAIRHHRSNLKPGGWFVGIVPDAFFTVSGADVFRAVIRDQWHVVGFIKLPATLFQGAGKSILILENAEGGIPAPAKVLIADVPSFSDEAAAAPAIRAIDEWFEQRKRS